jgi:hypothetical protein
MDTNSGKGGGGTCVYVSACGVCVCVCVCVFASAHMHRDVLIYEQEMVWQKDFTRGETNGNGYLINLYN